MTPAPRKYLFPVFRRPQTVRRPTPAEMGDEVTIAIVALTAPYGHFVSVSDQMISHDDILPGDESALIKSLQISNNWSVAFSANKIENVLPLLDRVSGKIERPAETLNEDQLQGYFTSAMSEMIRQDFFNRRLARYGYRDIEAFLLSGKDQLGDIFFELCRELNEAELGVEFIIYGYDTTRTPRLFELTGKGEIIDRMALRYAVVGSGYWMASASLKRKQGAAIDFDSMVYRLLEAKFSAETASGVGRRTTVKFKRPDQHDFLMDPNKVEEIRAIWEGIQHHPEPLQAVEIIGKVGMAMRQNDKLYAARRQQIEQDKLAGSKS